MSTSDNSAPRILVADDQPDVLEAFRLLLKAEGYRTETAASPENILGSLESQDFDILLMDFNYARDTTSGQEGLNLLKRIQVLDCTLPVVVMTAWGSVELTVEAMREGRSRFYPKTLGQRTFTLHSTDTDRARAGVETRQMLEAENQILASKDHPQLVAEARRR